MNFVQLITEVIPVIEDIITIYNELKADGVLANLTQDLSGNSKVTDLVSKAQILGAALAADAKVSKPSVSSAGGTASQ